MKRHLLLIAVMLMAFVTVQADDFGYLTVQKTDGSEQSFTALGLTLAFEGTSMIATQNGQTATLSLADLKKMYFSSTPAGVEELAVADAQEVRVFTLSGVDCGAYQSLSDAQRSLKKGIYVVKKGENTVKIVVR